MKKRFTLMMMVLCFLMSIPLKMMASDKITAASHYKEGSNWKDENTNFVFTTHDGKFYTCVLKDVPEADANRGIYFRVVKNGTQYGPQSTEKDLELKSDYQQAYSGATKALLIKATAGKTYTITWNNVTNQIKYDASEGGSTEEWNTVKTNCLTAKPRVYTQGFYLAGNFFTFDEKDKINYDDAVFKFQQQTDQDISIAKGAKTVYEVYKVEIPASLKALAQVMYVDEFGNRKYIFGPGSAYDINKDKPQTDKSIGWYDATVNACDPINKEIDNCWNFVSRNESQTEYSDGMYNLYIAVDATTHEVKKWKIVHDSRKRVAYFISDAADATAMPIYDAYDKDVEYFSNRFYGSVNFAEDRSYFVISNLVLNREDDIVNRTKGKYGTVVSASGDTNPKSKYIPTTNKLFLMGNGGLDFANTDPNNTVCPNEKPIKFGADWSGNQIVEYNPSKGKWEIANTDNHLGFAGEVQFQGGKRVKITSVSMVGDAIPGTSKLDATGKEVWDYTSPAANMTYDDVEQCYTTTIVTTVDEGKKHFRFVGNHDPKINWYEDTDGKEADKMAKTPLSDPNVKGHTADANDPNKVNYTQGNEKPEEDWNIIWNRPAGRWTVRLYFYTYNVAGEPVTDYYYTISPCRDLELRDCVNIVYKSEDTKRVIKNVGEYKFLRTWSDDKAWMVSKDIDIYVVDALTPNKDKNAVTIHLQQLDSKDKSGKYLLAELI